jgi:hypothetical protein
MYGVLEWLEHAYNPSTWETEAGETEAQDHSGQHSKSLSQKTKFTVCHFT